MYKPGSTFVNSTGFQRQQAGAPALFPADYSEVSSISFTPPAQQGLCEPEPCAQWWTITGTAREIQRRSAGAQLQVLPWTTINAAGLAGTDAQIVIRWEADVMVADLAAGFRVSILAPAVTCSIRVPSTGRVITNQNGQNVPGVTAPLDAIVKDTLVTIGASCGPAPIGETNARVTRQYTDGATDLPVNNAPGALPALPGTYKVPSRAKFAQFSVAGAFPGAGAGIQWIAMLPDGAGNVIPSGVLDNWGSRTSPRVAVPGNAIAFRLLGFAATDQITCTWGLDV